MQTLKLRPTWAFQALADETRFRAMRLLANSGFPLRAGQLASAMKLPPNQISRHLQILEEAGLTTTTRSGKAHYICVNTAKPSNAPLVAAVLAMEDETGILFAEMDRLSEAQCVGNAPITYSGDGVGSPPVSLGSSGL